MSVRSSLISIVLLLGATAAALSCGDPSPMGVAAPMPAATPSLTPQAGGNDGDERDDEDEEEEDEEDQDGDSLVTCRPLPYDSVTQTIGPAGGVLVVGRNWLVVPRGALRDTVTITAVAPSDTVAWVRLQPQGLRFQTTAFLVATYDNCRVPRKATPRIALVTDSLDVIGYLVSRAFSARDVRLEKGHHGYKGRRRIVGELPHFSNYAVAW
jgi:hypothetical protein